jgi:hypothetical protein
MPPIDVPYGSDYWAKRFGADLNSPTGFMGSIGAPDISDLGRLGPLLGMTLFHGSPHRFNMFELSEKTARSGSGAQVYGYGMYFAKQKGETKTYKELGQELILRDGEKYKPRISDDRLFKLAEKQNTDELLNIARHHEAQAVAEEKAWRMKPMMQKTHRASDDHYNKVGRLRDRAQQAREYAEDIKKGRSFQRGEGHTYQVEIDDAVMDKMLGYHDYLYQQPHVVDAIQANDPELWARLQKLEDDVGRPLEGSDVASSLKTMLYDREMQKEMVNRTRNYSQLKNLANEVEEMASKHLDDLGIPGIRVSGGRFSPTDDDTFVLFNMDYIDEVIRDGELVYKAKGL